MLQTASAISQAVGDLQLSALEPVSDNFMSDLSLRPACHPASDAQVGSSERLSSSIRLGFAEQSDVRFPNDREEFALKTLSVNASKSNRFLNESQ
jgi:hypothetical protein